MSKAVNKVDDLEIQSHQNIIRIVAFLEKAEGQDPVDFFELWLVDVIGKNLLSPFSAIERARRVPTRPLLPGALPRPILLKLLYYHDAILRTGRRKETSPCIIKNYLCTLIFLVKSQKTKKKHFQEIKKRLRSLGYSYSMQYSAKLCVAAFHSFLRDAYGGSCVTGQK